MGELGSLLVRAREARGLTLEDAERDTRISRRYLAALESEQFEDIPAPVYARGFLRSYSQYLGLDPAEALAMFPREDDPDYQRAGDPAAQEPRASRERPISPVSAARPTWRSGPSAQHAQQQTFPQAAPRELPRETPANRPTPLGRPKREAGPATATDPTWEPVIGIDMGVATPANRIKTDPAAQTRSVVVAIAALGVIVGAVLLAILISNLGAGADPPPGTGVDAALDGDAPATSPTTSGTGTDSATPGIVPTLIGLTESEAKPLITSAGYVVREIRTKNSAERGRVIDQSPIPGTEWPQGQNVQIVISEGP